MKFCTSCRFDKQLDAFSPHKNGSQGRHHHCRECRNRAARAKVSGDPRGPYQRELNPKPSGKPDPLLLFLKQVARPGDEGNVVAVVSCAA